VTDARFATESTVEVTDVSKWFGQKVAVSELSCSFGPGVTGLLGPNGAGKTTFLRMLVGLLTPSEGTIRLLGESPRSDPEVLRRVGFALDTVGLTDVGHRKVGTFSKGMRQRAKVAAALAHDPLVLFLDEPLNGTDPVQRAHLIDLFSDLADRGHTVIVSSHVLHEVERMAGRVIAMVDGRLAAAGSVADLRTAMTDIPRRIRIDTSDPRCSSRTG
jgi:ABC-2 type transport system ATP-binding protein